MSQLRVGMPGATAGWHIRSAPAPGSQRTRVLGRLSAMKVTAHKLVRTNPAPGPDLAWAPARGAWGEGRMQKVPFSRLLSLLLPQVAPVTIVFDSTFKPGTKMRISGSMPDPYDS